MDSLNNHPKQSHSHPPRRCGNCESPRPETTGRAARGTVKQINRAWGIATVEVERGNPEAGDEAYSAADGPGAGLLKIESIEETTALIAGDLPALRSLEAGARIETMAPSAAAK